MQFVRCQQNCRQLIIRDEIQKSRILFPSRFLATVKVKCSRKTHVPLTYIGSSIFLTLPQPVVTYSNNIHVQVPISNSESSSHNLLLVLGFYFRLLAHTVRFHVLSFRFACSRHIAIIAVSRPKTSLFELFYYFRSSFLRTTI